MKILIICIAIILIPGDSMSFFGLKIKGKQVCSEEIEPILLKYCDNITFRSEKYILPDNPGYIMRKSRSNNYEYDGEIRKCTDAVRILLGWLSEKGFGRVLVIDVKIISGNRIHNCVGFIVDNQLQLWEPQGGKMYLDKGIIMSLTL